MGSDIFFAYGSESALRAETMRDSVQELSPKVWTRAGCTPFSRSEMAKSRQLSLRALFRARSSVFRQAISSAG